MPSEHQKFERRLPVFEPVEPSRGSEELVAESACGRATAHQLRREWQDSSKPWGTKADVREGAQAPQGVEERRGEGDIG